MSRWSDRSARPIPVDDTDALVTTHPAAGAGRGHRRLRPGAAGRRARRRRGRRARRPGRRRQRRGAADRRGDAGPGRARSRTSRCCWARRQRRQLRGARRDGRRGRSPLPGSRTSTARGTPGLDLRAGIARQLIGCGHQSHRRRPALHRRRPEAVQPPPRRADRPAGLSGVDGMSERGIAELADGAGRAARPAGRGGARPPAATSPTSSCCRSPSSSRPPTSRSCGGWAAALRRVPRAGGLGQDRRVPGADRRHRRRAGTWSARSSATRPNTLRHGRIRCTR